MLGLNVLLGRDEAQGEADAGTRSGRSSGWSTRRARDERPARCRGSRGHAMGEAEQLQLAGGDARRGWTNPARKVVPDDGGEADLVGE